MPPKKSASTAAATKKAKSTPSHPTYKDMIIDAIVQLKERNGSSRQALKKYIKSNHNITANNFESLFNTALKRGVDKGDFVQPKGPSGTVKLKKKDPAEKKKTAPKSTAAKAAEKKAATTKKTATTKKAAATTTKKATTTKAAPKKAAAPAKKAAPKKAAPAKKAAAPKKAATSKAKVTKTTTKRATKAK